MKIQLKFAVLALCTSVCFAGENLLPMQENGLPKLTPVKKTNYGEQVMSLPGGAKSLQLTSKNDFVRLQTAMVRNLPASGYLVYEVTARSASKAKVMFIAVGYRYKSIEERPFELGPEWKKYAAVIKCDPDQKHQEFFGRIDLGKNQQVEIAKVMVYHIADLKALPKDYEKSLNGKDAFALPYKMDKNASAGKNMLPNAGCFAIGMQSHLNPVGQTGNAVFGLKAEPFENGDAVYTVSVPAKQKKVARFMTPTVPITGKYMAVEVMARAVEENNDSQFSVIAVGVPYKYISHMRYKPTQDWHKYISFVEIPEDVSVLSPKKKVFFGLVDVNGNTSIEIGKVSVYFVNDVKEFPRDVEKTITGLSPYAKPYKVDKNAPAGKNMLPDEGYFILDMRPHLLPVGQTGNAVFGLRAQPYEKGNTVYTVSVPAKQKKVARFMTERVPVTGKYMAVEVMARAVQENNDSLFSVIAVGIPYKYINHLHYKPTTEWRKYISFVEIPEDVSKLPPKKNVFFGFVDVHENTSIEIGKVSVYTVNSVKDLPRDVEKTLAGFAPFAKPYKVEKKAPAGKNILPDDGYFVLDEIPHLLAKGKNSAIDLKKEKYGKSDHILVLRHTGKQRYTRFGTMNLPITGNLMVFEAMVRVAGGKENSNCGFMAVGSKYKYITHKHFNLTPEWRKLVAVVEIPEDPKNSNMFWGFIDIPVGATVEVGKVAVYSMNNDTRIAGMADDAATEAKKKSVEPTVADSKTPIPGAKKFISSQVGNRNPIAKIRTRLSSEIKAESVAGASLSGTEIVECPAEGVSYGSWSPWWVIAEPGKVSAAPRNYYSSYMRSPYASGENLTVRWKKPVRITQIRLTPRDGVQNLRGFPLDWHLELSADGKTFREVAREKNYNKTGVLPLVSFPEQNVMAVRFTADRNRPEIKTCSYFQFRRLEALTKDGKNMALVKHGASAESRSSLDLPLVSHQVYYDHIVRCGIKHLFIDINSRPKSPYSIYDGIALGSLGYKNLTAFIKFMRDNGVKMVIRLNMNLRGRKEAEIKDLAKTYSEIYLPHVRSWKGLVEGYNLGGEENQYRMGKPLGYPVTKYKKTFNDSVAAACRKIREIDPNVALSVSTALFDFDWTEGELKYGLGKPGLVDTFSVHIYRETDPYGSYPEKCYSFFVDGRRGLETERMFTRAEDEMKAYRKLLNRYNPKLKISSNETCICAGKENRGMTTTELGQAKYVSRQYIMHQFYGIGPTMWWNLISSPEKDYGRFWGMVHKTGYHNLAWYSYSYFNAIFDNSWKPDKEFPLQFTPADKRFYSYTFKRNEKEWMAAAWVAVSMRDANTGKETDILIPGTFAKNTEVECIDMLNGGIQKMNVVWTEKGLLLKGIILRDYALVFRPKAPGK